MKCNAVIEVEGDTDVIYSTFEPEVKAAAANRSSYSVKKTNSGVKFTVNATDSVAMRAMLNSISKALYVIEKSGEIS